MHSETTEMQLVGAIRQGDGGSKSQSIAMIRPRPGAPSVAVIAGASLPFASQWKLARVDAGRIIIEHENGTRKLLGVESDIPDTTMKVSKSEGNVPSESISNQRPAAIIRSRDEFPTQANFVPLSSESLDELEWKETVSLEDIEKALSDSP